MIFFEGKNILGAEEDLTISRIKTARRDGK